MASLSTSPFPAFLVQGAPQCTCGGHRSPLSVGSLAHHCSGGRTQGTCPAQQVICPQSCLTGIYLPASPVSSVFKAGRFLTTQCKKLKIKTIKRPIRTHTHTHKRQREREREREGQRQRQRDRDRCESGARDREETREIHTG